MSSFHALCVERNNTEQLTDMYVHDASPSKHTAASLWQPFTPDKPPNRKQRQHNHCLSIPRLRNALPMKSYHHLLHLSSV
mmetsp:Transcript_224/g.609  ORF Transcript_224/g.609 Transcript_224/m.609 type:complete len:80 (-) Transcript_224:84-323(-)